MFSWPTINLHQIRFRSHLLLLLLLSTICMENKRKKVYEPNGKSVKEYAYLEDKNYPNRKTMEDNYFALDGLPDEIKKEQTGSKQYSGLFAVFDGHGGSDVADSCVEIVPNVFLNLYPKGKDNTRELFQNVFKKVDDQLKFVGASECGSTCCVVFVRKQNGKKICTVANLGDTRAVLVKANGTFETLTVDHKASNASQQERVKKQGGTILRGRVAGQLAITRSFGDLELKGEGVSCVPDINEFQIDSKANYLIVASDGLWDVCIDQQSFQKTIQLTLKCKTTEEICKVLVDHALKEKSKDNISVMAIKFN